MNVKRIYDQYSSEDYLCFRLKPRGELLCGYCHEPYEAVDGHTFDDDDCVSNVCKHCGEVSFPYEDA